MNSNSMELLDKMPDHSSAGGIVEQRILRLEERFDRMESGAGGPLPMVHPAWPFLLGLLALGFGYLGLGLPQHYYQLLFALLLVVLLYHRQFLVRPKGGWHWPQVLLNFLLIALLFKLLIGGGIASPFEWLKMPVISRMPPPEGGSWYGKMVPDYTIQWQGIPRFSEWALDVTKIQTLLLIATLAGTLFRFQPLTSLTALALLLISIPTYLNFNWDWVILFLILGSVSVYIQSRASIPPRT